LSFTQFDDFFERFFLDDHRTDKYDVRPFNIV